MPLPFDLPAVSRGFAELTGAARETGAELANAAARSIAALVGCDVAVQGRAVPGRPAVRTAAARLAIDLGALPGQAFLEVDPTLVVAVVDRLAGGPGAAGPATALTPVEASVLELIGLAAIDGACSVEGVDALLSPRLARGLPDPAAPLAIELDLIVGAVAGRGRLLVPAAAVRALRGPACADGPSAGLAVPVSLRQGSTTLSPDELQALAPGDVVVVDGTDGPAVLALGPLRARGRIDDETFHVEEIEMTDRLAELPIPIDVELARLELPLSELARLEPGAAFPLGVDRRGIVTLRAGERAIARGELVDLDGAVGVRILSVEVAP